MREADLGSQCVDATKLNFIKRSRPSNEFRFSLATNSATDVLVGVCRKCVGAPVPTKRRGLAYVSKSKNRYSVFQNSPARKLSAYSSPAPMKPPDKCGSR
jgi:hypothetical protein